MAASALSVLISSLGYRQVEASRIQSNTDFDRRRTTIE
jgi:hypothetical protein